MPYCTKEDERMRGWDGVHRQGKIHTHTHTLLFYVTLNIVWIKFTWMPIKFLCMRPMSRCRYISRMSNEPEGMKTQGWNGGSYLDPMTHHHLRPGEAKEPR